MPQRLCKVVCLFGEIGLEAAKLVSPVISDTLKSVMLVCEFKVLVHVGGAKSLLQLISLLDCHLS